MSKNQTDYSHQQPDGKSNQQPTQSSPDSPQGKPNMNIQDTEEEEVKSTIQRRPQFRLKENMKKDISEFVFRFK